MFKKAFLLYLFLSINQLSISQTYEDVFGDTAAGDKNMWYDYGQKYDRQSLRKDFNFKLTKSKVMGYNDKRLN